MLKFTPRGQLGLQHVLLGAAILVGIAVDKGSKAKEKEPPKPVPLTQKTNLLNTCFVETKK